MYNSDADSEYPQLVIGADLHSIIIREFHVSVRGGHCGVDKTLSKIASKFHLTGIRKYSSSISKGDIKDLEFQTCGTLTNPCARATV